METIEMLVKQVLWKSAIWVNIRLLTLNGVKISLHILAPCNIFFTLYS